MEAIETVVSLLSTAAALLGAAATIYQGSIKKKPVVATIFKSIVVFILFIFIGIILLDCINSAPSSETNNFDKSSDGLTSYTVGQDHEDKLETKSAETSLSAEETVKQPSKGASYRLFNEVPSQGTRNQIEGATEDNLGNIYYDSLRFSVTSFTDSMKTNTLAYVNRGYSRFKGVFYIPKLDEGVSKNTVAFTIGLDGTTVFDSGSLDQYSDPCSFDIDISDSRKVEITCTLLEGTGSGVIGGGAGARGHLANAEFC